MKRFPLITLLAVLCASGAAVRAQGRLSLEVTDGKQALPGVVIQVHPYALWAQTDRTGKAVVIDVPEGACEVEASLLGYVTRTVRLSMGKDAGLKITMEEATYALKDVVVTSQRKESPGSTVTRIDAQAIAHLQATSLSDVLQLLPGETVTSNPTLTAASRFQSRTLDGNDGNNAFGAAIVMDGIPLSTNAERANTGGTLSSAGSGVDLRSIGTDEIESIEVIRGIPSAEYGDLSSGTMVVRSKTGVSDLRGGVRIYPGIIQASLAKGIKAGQGQVVNLSWDLADGKSDPRYRTDTYLRTGLSASHTLNLPSGGMLTTRLRYGFVRDWSGPDPDEPVQDVSASTREHNLSLSHGGRFHSDALLARSWGYDFSFSFKDSESFSRKLLGGNTPLTNSLTEGTFHTVLLPLQYYGEGGTTSRPLNAFFKLFDKFTLTAGPMSNNISVGAEWRMDGNAGPGYHDSNPALPLSTGGLRQRPYYALPFVHQAVLYAEDAFRLPFVKGKDYPALSGQLGLRLTCLQPHRSERMFSLSPRVNLSLDISRWLRLRGGYGLTDKMPSQAMLYPEPGWLDLIHISAVKDGQYIGAYTTRIFDRNAGLVRPMRAQKAEMSIEAKTAHGQSFLVTAWMEKTDGGFGSRTLTFDAVAFDRPSVRDTLVQSRSVPGNTDYHGSWGVEFDFDLGRIAATGTSFFLSGAWTETRYHSTEEVYVVPRGPVETYTKTWVAYPSDNRDHLKRRFSSTLRVVQSFPTLKMVISAAVQAIFYDYSLYKNTLALPLAWISPSASGGAVRTEITQAQIADAANVRFRGYSLQDQIYQASAWTGVPEVWPPLGSVSLRASKNVTRHTDLSFYVNNLFFQQPWQKSSVSTQAVERNGNLFAWGFELSVHF